MLFVGSNDALVAPKDFSILKGSLPEICKIVDINDYNHLDYMWAADANQYVNKEVFSFFQTL
jgi:hypothetical protein